MKKILIIFIFISGCSTNKNQVSNNFFDIQYSENLSFEEFQIKLEEYTKNSPYPNIDN